MHDLLLFGFFWLDLYFYNIYVKPCSDHLEVGMLFIFMQE